MMSNERWNDARHVAQRAVQSSFHCTISSINPDGTAHITPIGSLHLTSRGCGVYFEVFNTRLAANLDRDPRIEILAIDSRPALWLWSLLRGRFAMSTGRSR